ncbi:hypothetical protein [Streptomyces sp. WG5]|uniref:hypothetical protein n=1 Tax=Streptomyces sp. WG5 TaxID=3417648 RepID=UPI003CF34A46
MTRIPALNTLLTDALREARRQLFNVYEHQDTPENVKEAAAVLYNFYGAELDARMAAKGEGQ